VSSTKQKLNTRSSMENEIVGADDFMPAICWTRYFMEAQGYQVNDNVLFQDNKSAILLRGEEWKGFEQQAHEAYPYSVFLYY
jgi:hypothetical protein